MYVAVWIRRWWRLAKPLAVAPTKGAHRHFPKFVAYMAAMLGDSHAAQSGKPQSGRSALMLELHCFT